MTGTVEAASTSAEPDARVAASDATSGPSSPPGTPIAVRDIRALADRLVERPGRLLVVSDFDGTLSPVNRDPLGARILPLARLILC